MNHSGASQPGTSSSLIPSKYRFAQVRVNGVKRKLVFTDSSEKPRKEDVDPKTIELMSHFFVSQGLPLKCAREPTFINLVRYLNPSHSIPSPFQMKSFLANSSKKLKERPTAHFTRGVGPLCLTLDYVGDDQKFLVYSIHWFEKAFERQNIVCFWRLRLRDIRDSESLLLPARTSVDSISYATVKFDSIVLPSLEAYDLVVRSRVGKRYYVCFHHYMTMFVENVMRIPELAKGLDQLNNLVCFIREHSQFYTLFENIKKARNVQFDLPITKRGERWEQTFMFLTKCLALHDTFFEYAEEAGYQNYISNMMFNYLLYFQRLLQQCVNISRELSQPHNSISQVIPKINELKTFILGSKRRYRFQNTVEESLKYVFENITHDKSHFLYEIASLLDPRYAYGKTFSLEKWLNIERRASEEFQITSEDSDLITVHQRQKVIKDNFEMYRQMLELGVEQSENPFQWWTECHKAMKFLSEVALQYLACPATTVNASYYFGKGGKFEHLCDRLSFKELDTFLINAGMHQKYVGKGFDNNEEEITPELKESLENTANRLHVRRVFIPRDPTLRVSQFFHNLKVPVALFPVKVISNPSVIKKPPPPLESDSQADEALEEVHFLENKVKIEDDPLRAPPMRFTVPLEDKPTDLALRCLPMLSEVKNEDLEIADNGERLGKLYDEALRFARLEFF
ncbi:hypothetical protein B9Z55_011138 [Caenorhabditis nigoni]|uniref:HAT C-terminal dimerisation domain-containing protein n=1 Tax=Caenorhabditis nigoni TaxID=1611254 RepID=A0A2G5UIT2_9PELO|nr:hypothetical protein B9Z55_011138 [Caenorhabditis nigoni]